MNWIIFAVVAAFGAFLFYHKGVKRGWRESQSHGQFAGTGRIGRRLDTPEDTEQRIRAAVARAAERVNRKDREGE